ncbi:helix-turn-helix domain-containing protein [Lentzea waywayandensis]|uniref:helix-turn-helix domain-containing protein n=1 Tax=Lentzea waywayandensis TaxID=84724 RepID=UPI001160D29F|nr:helix-turn-helix transcriptional regulator [Lentzea waywayandensis]
MSTVLGREFGESLRAVIQRTGLLEAQLARQVGWEHAKLSDLVNGKGGTSLEEFTFLLGLCGAAPKEYAHLRKLFLQSKERGWLQWQDGVRGQVRTLMQHEQLATGITIWSPMFVPGLLQIRAYVLAVIAAYPDIAQTDVSQIAAAREDRRNIVGRGCSFVFYVHEQALRLPVGGHEVWKEQLHDILRMSVRPYITIRIVPVAAGAHPGGDGAFTMMAFEKLEPIVYVESLNSNLFLDDKVSLNLYGKIIKAFDRIALGEEESRELITSMLT